MMHWSPPKGSCKRVFVFIVATFKFHLTIYFDLKVTISPPYFEALYCFICGRREVAVARYRMICLVLVNSNYSLCRVEPVAQFPAKCLTLLLFLHHCLSVRCWAAVALCYGLAIFHVFLKWNVHFQTFILVNACQSGDITKCLAFLFVDHFKWN